MSRNKRMASSVVICLLVACANDDPRDEPVPDATDGTEDDRSGAEAMPDGTGDDDAGGEATADVSDATADEGTGPERPPPLVRFYPVDLATARGTSLPEVRIEWVVVPPPRESLDALAAAITLHTWPELDPLPTTSAIEEEWVSDTSRIVFTATSPLADRWYALRIASLPAPFTWPYYEHRFPLADGAEAIRFRPDSHPIFWGLDLCDRTTEYSAFVWFSEPILAERPVADIVAITQPDAPDLRCEVYMASGMATGEVDLRCPGFDPALPFRLEIDAGLVSPSGMPVTDLADNPTPLAYDLLWDDLPATIPECRVLRQ